MKIENVLLPKNAIMQVVNSTIQTQLKDELLKQGIKGVKIHSIEWEAEGLRLYYSSGEKNE